jgi:hypothetical protein
MITYSNIVTKFEEFVANHFFLKTFSHGSPSDVDLDKFEVYPLLHLVYTGGGYDSNVKTYNLEVYILDSPPRDEDKTDFQKQVISASEQAAEDILADIENGGNIFQFGYDYDLQSAQILPLEDERSNVLAGTLLSLSIGVAYTYDSCNAPLSGVDPEGTDPQPFRSRGLLRVRELDGNPDVLSVATINVPNGSLVDDGSGQVTLSFDSLPAGTEGQTLVYQSGAWVAGYPISTGQQTIFKRFSPSTQRAFAPVLTTMDFSSILGGGVTFENQIRAGAAFGFNVSSQSLQANPLTANSDVQVELKYEITLDADGIVVPQINAKTGVFGQVAMTFPVYTTAGTYTDTVTSDTSQVLFYQSSNLIQFALQSSVTGTYRIHYIKVTIDHA